MRKLLRYGDLWLVAALFGTILLLILPIPAVLLDLLLSADAIRRPERLEGLIRVCAADVLSRPGRDGAAFAPAQHLAAALGVLRRVDAAQIAATFPEAAELPRRIRGARLDALRGWLEGGAGRNDARSSVHRD